MAPAPIVALEPPAPPPALDHGAPAVLRPLRSAEPAPRPATVWRVDTVSNYESLLALGPAWDRLAEVAGLDHPFLSHEWIVTWWKCFGEGQRLHVLVVTANGEAAAIAPLMLCRSRIWGLRVRRLQLISSVQTPRADFLVGGPRSEEAYRVLWECLAAQKSLWDALVLPQLPSGSAALEQVPRLAARDGFLVGSWRRASDSSPWVSLRGTWESYFAGLDGKHRSNLRNRTKRLEQLGPVQVESISAPGDVGPALDEGFALEAAAWKGRSRTAISSCPELMAFYTGLAARAAERGWLRLQFLTVGGRRIAFAFMLSFRNVLFLLKPGYDPAYAAYSPSNLLLSRVLRDGFGRGLDRFDFLGEDDPWKLDWTSEKRPHHWIFVFPDTARSRLLHYVKFRLLPSVKKLRRAARAGMARLGWTFRSR